MQVRLELFHQKANVKRVVLKQDAIIGRSAECGLRIASSLVSRQHCKISLGENQVLVRDLGSSNGTFLNGSKLTPEHDYPIEPNAQLSVGGVNFTVRFDVPAAAIPPQPGSTVDLPGIAALREKEAESLTTEWTAEPQLQQSAATNGPPPEVSAAPVVTTDASETSSIDASGLAHAVPRPAHEEAEIEAGWTPPDEEAEEAEIELGGIAPLLVPPEVASQDVVSASAGDEIDTVTSDITPGDGFPAISFGTSEEGPWGDAAPAFDVDANPDFPAETPDEAVAQDSPVEEPRKKGGLFSFFGLLGKKKKEKPEAAPAEHQVNEAVPVAAAVAPVPAVAVAAAVVAATETAAALEETATFSPAAAPAPEENGATDDDVMGFLGAVGQDEPAEEESENPSDGGLGDFLKNLG